MVFSDNISSSSTNPNEGISSSLCFRIRPFGIVASFLTVTSVIPAVILLGAEPEPCPSPLLILAVFSLPFILILLSVCSLFRILMALGSPPSSSRLA